MKNSFERLDNFIDQLLGETGYNFLVKISRYGAVLLSTGLLVICTAHFVTNTQSWNRFMVKTDLHNIMQALSAVDADCGICAIAKGRYSLECLTHTYPSTDELVGWTLTNTKGWRSKQPYLKIIPTIQGYQYILLSVQKGLFIVPADEVTLPTGQTLGSTIVWDDSTDIESLMQPGQLLCYDGQPLAACYKPRR